ncbi:MAG: hypothetical protein KAY24_08355, partial [Candidatus Eisenbacteria sp.]|nr:hypothetical protein [Candidatus Eisenbacteria bacterium]
TSHQPSAAAAHLQALYGTGLPRSVADEGQLLDGNELRLDITRRRVFCESECDGQLPIEDRERAEIAWCAGPAKRACAVGGKA